MLEQYTVADLLTWLTERTLVINREFQRNSGVWPTAAQVYLIDTIIRDMPMPKIYLRTRTDVNTMRTYREVVDGQQRLMAMQSYAKDEFPLRLRGNDMPEVNGKRYSELDDEFKQRFLEYEVPVYQLMNASDSLVFDVFQRLNTYNYNLSPQELRHGKYHGGFRDAVITSSRQWAFLWDKYNVIAKRARVRMADDELMAQMFGIIIEGVTDGGQRRIERLYKTYDADMPATAPQLVDRTLDYISSDLSDVMETNLARSPHLLMLFAAVAHALFGIPEGAMSDDMPKTDDAALSDVIATRRNLATLSDALDDDISHVPERFHDFLLASSGSTQRIRTRRVRFKTFYKALMPDLV